MNELTIFWTIYALLGLLSGIYMFYLDWKEGQDIKIADIFTLLCCCVATPLLLVLLVSRLQNKGWSGDWDGVIFKGKDKK